MGTLRLPIVAVLAGLAPAQLPAQPTCNSADRAIVVILDASGSMNAQLAGGETRIAAARNAVKGVAALVPGKAQLSLRLYGAQSPASRKDCQDTHVPVPFAAAETVAGAIGGAVDGARAQGYTPIAYSLEQASIGFPSTAKQRVVVLVSDGKETCKGDPVVTAKALAAKGVTVHTIGFAVDSAARMQLKSVAAASGGTYFDAPQGSELPEKLKAALNACPHKIEMKPKSAKPGKLRSTEAAWLRSHAVIDAQTGKQVATIDSGRREIPLPPGIYEVTFGPASWKGIEVRAGETTTIAPAALKVSRAVGAAVVDTETGETHGQLDRMSSSTVVMPGLYDLVFPSGLRWPYIRLDGGKTVTLDPVEIRMKEGSKYSSARILHDGKQVAVFDRVTWKHSLPPGDYVVEIDGKPQPKTLKPGEETEVSP